VGSTKICFDQMFFDPVFESRKGVVTLALHSHLALDLRFEVGYESCRRLFSSHMTQSDTVTS
jgi:hypothetical protein